LAPTCLLALSRVRNDDAPSSFLRL